MQMIHVENTVFFICQVLTGEAIQTYILPKKIKINPLLMFPLFHRGLRAASYLAGSCRRR